VGTWIGSMMTHLAGIDIRARPSVTFRRRVPSS
jgi:hypothetical protein